MTKTTSSEATDQADEVQLQELTPQTLPYAFAKRHGVLIGQIEDDQVQLMHRPDFSPAILAEISRVTGRRLSLSPASDEQFDALLAQTYERGSDQAIAMMEGVGEELDLDQLAETVRQANREQGAGTMESGDRLLTVSRRPFGPC